MVSGRPGRPAIADRRGWEGRTGKGHAPGVVRLWVSDCKGGAAPSAARSSFRGRVRHGALGGKNAAGKGKVSGRPAINDHKWWRGREARRTRGFGFQITRRSNGHAGLSACPALDFRSQGWSNGHADRQGARPTMAPYLAEGAGVEPPGRAVPVRRASITGRARGLQQGPQPSACVRRPSSVSMKGGGCEGGGEKGRERVGRQTRSSARLCWRTKEASMFLPASNGYAFTVGPLPQPLQGCAARCGIVRCVALVWREWPGRAGAQQGPEGAHR
jgi:hypothetical protein